MELKNITESLRQELINLENIRSDLKELKTRNKAEDNFKERMNEMLSTALADLAISYDFILEAESCTDESDLEFLLEMSSDYAGEEYH